MNRLARLLLGFLLIGCSFAALPAQAQTVVSIGSGFFGPSGVAVDSSGNVFVADPGTDGGLEILAAGGCTLVMTSAFACSWA